MISIILFVLLIAIPEIAVAQEKATRGKTPLSLNEDSTVLLPPADTRRQTAPIALANKTIIELNALYDGSTFASNPDIHSQINQTDSVEPGIIAEWRERVFKTLKMHSSPRQSDPVKDSRLISNNELDAQGSEERTATQLALQETLQFAQERIPDIDRLVKALTLKLEISNRTFMENIETQAKEKEPGEVRAVKNNSDKEKLFVKTGLRLPIVSGKFGLISETEARYSNMSSFFKVKLDGQYDNSLGMTYILGRALALQVERQVTHTTDPLTGGNAQSNLNLVQLVCQF